LRGKVAEGLHKADERRCPQQMSEQVRRIKHETIPEWAQGLYYNKGLFSEALIYHDDEALNFELRGKEGGVVRFTHEMLQTLGEVIEEQEEQEEQDLSK
jgi:hypothetical protein